MKLWSSLVVCVGISSISTLPSTVAATAKPCDYAELPVQLGDLVEPAFKCQAASGFSFVTPSTLPTATELAAICAKCTDFIQAAMAQSTTLPSCVLELESGAGVTVDNFFRGIASQCESGTNPTNKKKNKSQNSAISPTTTNSSSSTTSDTSSSSSPLAPASAATGVIPIVTIPPSSTSTPSSKPAASATSQQTRTPTQPSESSNHTTEQDDKALDDSAATNDDDNDDNDEDDDDGSMPSTQDTAGLTMAPGLTLAPATQSKSKSSMSESASSAKTTSVASRTASVASLVVVSLAFLCLVAL